MCCTGTSTCLMCFSTNLAPCASNAAYTLHTHVMFVTGCIQTVHYVLLMLDTGCTCARQHAAYKTSCIILATCPACIAWAHLSIGPPHRGLPSLSAVCKDLSTNVATAAITLALTPHMLQQWDAFGSNAVATTGIISVTAEVCNPDDTSDQIGAPLDKMPGIRRF